MKRKVPPAINYNLFYKTDMIVPAKKITRVLRLCPRSAKFSSLTLVM